MIDLFTKIKLVDGRTAEIVDYIGFDYIVDVDDGEDWDTIIIEPEKIAEIIGEAGDF